MKFSVNSTASPVVSNLPKLCKCNFVANTEDAKSALTSHGRIF